MYVLDDGVETEIEIYYFYDDKDYKVEVRNLKEINDKPIIQEMAQTTSKFDVGEWTNLRSDDASRQVSAQVRQQDESDWKGLGSEWKFSLFQKKNAVYF
jgi:hypothetical protein